jgi:NitT/TauT family transport system substrate-binding protein
MTSRRPAILIASLLLTLLLAAPAVAGRPQTAAPSPLTKASFITQWVPQAQFAGYYVALAKGFYRQQGLELQIIDGGPERSSAAWLRRGRADFSSLWLVSALRLCDQGCEVVNLAQLVQQSALMLVARKKNRIFRLSDLQGRRVGLWGPPFDVQARLLFRQQGIDIIAIPQSFSINLFLRDGVAATSAMWYNEYHRIINSGIDPDELTTFRFADYGFNYPEDGIYVLKSFWRDHPDTCRAFVTATLKGWRAAFAEPEKTLDLVMQRIRRAQIINNRTQQRWMLDCMAKIMRPAAGGLPGRLDREAYRQVVNGLSHLQLIQKAPAWSDFHHFAGEEKP